MGPSLNGMYLVLQPLHTRTKELELEEGLRCMRADAARMKRSAIFKGEEFKRFDGEGESSRRAS